MTELAFTVSGVRAEPYAAVPTLAFGLRVEAPGQAVHALALRCQIRIEPQRRRYSPDEEKRLLELFGETPRWGDTLRPFLWTQVSTLVPGFRGETETDLPVPCSYDFEVAAAKYLHSLDGGDVPLLLLFSGTVFGKRAEGLAVTQVPWSKEASFRLPVATWREMMDHYFPEGGWMRLRRETLSALMEVKARRALATFDDVVEHLIRHERSDA
jgi:hypothetical protein